MKISTIFYITFCLGILSIAIAAESGNAPAAKGALAVVLVMLSIAGLILFLQICFSVYQWISLGNPFWERGDNKPTVVYRDHRKKDTKKMCPICQRPTHCKVQRSANGRFFVHVVKG